MTPAEKLALSRLALIEYLSGKERPDQHPDVDSIPGSSLVRVPQQRSRAQARRTGWFAGMTAAAQAWWNQHPANLALELTSPALGKVLRKRPFTVLAASAAVGALLVVTRPWRLVSLTTLVLGIVKSSKLSGVMMSALTGVQGWQGARRGREPQ